MVEDGEGFLFPSIDEENCINCMACELACPQINASVVSFRDPVDVYAARLTNSPDELKRSSSGGVFFAIARHVLMGGGVVYGAAFDDEFAVETLRVDSVDDLFRLQGSKYVQCNTNSAFSQIKRDLLEGKKVLYASTPCQIAGLLAFLGECRDGLITIDFVCHGVPSQKLFDYYLRWLQGEKGELTEYTFREKQFGWSLVSSYVCRQKKHYVTSSDPFQKAFMTGSAFRNCCYECGYSKKERCADITLCDFWGIQTEHPDFFDEMGVSGVLINSPLGKDLYSRLDGSIKYIESSYEQVSRRNRNLVEPTPRPECRESIYDNMSSRSAEEFIQHNLLPLVTKGDRLKQFIPTKVKQMIRMLRNHF